MRDTLLKLIDMCKETDGLWIEINPFFDEVWVNIFRGERRCRRVIARHIIEECEDAETLLKNTIKMCEYDMLESEEAAGLIAKLICGPDLLGL